MEYVRFNEGLNKYRLIPSTEHLWDLITDPNKDYYSSIFLYNEEHYKKWKASGSVSGIVDVSTNKLVFDFDDAANIENARKDALSLIARLISYGIPQEGIQVCFSGNKGWSVEVHTTSRFTPQEFKLVTFKLAGEYKSFDTVVNDPNRIFRLTGTKHPKTGLYKLPVSITQLSELPITTIKELAKDLNNLDTTITDSWSIIDLPETIINFKIPEKKKENKLTMTDFDLSKKPKWLSSQKYALQEGFFQSGERNESFMILASTYKNQGFSKEIVYRMLKGVAEKQAVRNGVDPYSNEELWNNITEVVFSSNWRGGSYSYDNTPLLRVVGERLGIPRDKTEDKIFVPVEAITDSFKRFATDIDKNTIKLGIPAIDENVRITTSMSVGLLASPGSGKTSISLGILNTNSLAGIPSMFFSLDMGAPLVYQRLIQRHLGYSNKKIFNIYQTDNQKEIQKIEKVVADNYKNVKFCFRSGVSVEDIRNHIVQYQDTSGEKIKLVVIDYLETVLSPFQDGTASSAYVSQALKDIANDLELTILILLQPQKQTGDSSAELLSARNVKGSSVVEQSLSVIFTMWRPGFSPVTPEEDKYLSLAVVKNRMGGLAKFDFKWDGLSGSIEELDEIESQELSKILERKAKEKLAKDLI